LGRNLAGTEVGRSTSEERPYVCDYHRCYQRHWRRLTLPANRQTRRHQQGRPDLGERVRQFSDQADSGHAGQQRDPQRVVSRQHRLAGPDNNAPYGVTFAGFSPQNHTDLTLDDLGVPGKAEKYAAYNYLLSNQVQPTSDWAGSAADALNKKYNTTAYHAIDGETLGFGNEYIHSAANGYGMTHGTFNPTATGEFFWGNI
jgi:hypothetical protein